MERGEEAGKPGKRWGLLWLLAWGAMSSVWCVTASAQLGATVDEPLYVELGLRYWRTANHRDLVAGGGTMPLPVDVATLPLYLWERYNGIPFDPEADLSRLLPVARLAVLVFWCLLLVYAGKIGRC